MSVCPSILATGARTPDAIGIGEAPPDALERREKTMVPIVDRSVPPSTRHVPSCEPLQKSIGRDCRSNQSAHAHETLWGDCSYVRIRAFGVTVADGCKVHVAEAGNVICVGTSEFVKF